MNLWDGQHTIVPVKVDELSKTLEKCFGNCDNFRITEDRYGNLKVAASHHDGTNQFVIKRLNKKGIVTVNFLKNVYI